MNYLNQYSICLLPNNFVQNMNISNINLPNMNLNLGIESMGSVENCECCKSAKNISDSINGNNSVNQNTIPFLTPIWVLNFDGLSHLSQFNCKQNQISNNIPTNNTPNKKNKEVKKRIPKRLKDLVWEKYINSTKKNGKCFCCREENIKNTDFICGHVIPECKGGETKLYNLRPICGQCNLSMGSKNMHEFIEECGFWYNEIRIDELDKICNLLQIENTLYCKEKLIKIISLHKSKNKFQERVKSLFLKYKKTEDRKYIDDIFSISNGNDSFSNMKEKDLQLISLFIGPDFLEWKGFEIKISKLKEMEIEMTMTIQKSFANFNNEPKRENLIELILELNQSLHNRNYYDSKISILELRKIESALLLKKGKNKFDIISNIIINLIDNYKCMNKFLGLIYGMPINSTHKNNFINFLISLIPVPSPIPIHDPKLIGIQILNDLFGTCSEFDLVEKISQNELILDLFYRFLYFGDISIICNIIKAHLGKTKNYNEIHKIYYFIFSKEYKETHLSCTKHTESQKILDKIIEKAIKSDTFPWGALSTILKENGENLYSSRFSHFFEMNKIKLWSNM